MSKNQLVGNIGLYYCCYQLSRRNWNVMPTARNARGIDIIAYNEDASDFVGIQVKTLSKSPPVPLGKSLDKLMGDYWVIINNAAMPEENDPDKIESFIMLPDEVRRDAHEGEKGGHTSYWLQPKAYQKECYRNRWDIIQCKKDI